MKRSEGVSSFTHPSGLTLGERQLKRPSATTRLRQGRIMIFTGTVAALAGIGLYCVTTFASELRNEPATFLGESLVVIAVGLGVWLLGAVRYLNATIDTGFTDENL